eukprot:IDg18293t1
MQRRKVCEIEKLISEHRSAVDECLQLHSILRKCTNNMDGINRDLSALCSQVSVKLAPLRVAEAFSTGETLDRIVSRIEHLETRIDTCCAAAVSM